MKIKDLPDRNMKHLKFKAPDGEVYYWHSQWECPEGKAGIWGKKDLKSDRIYPIFLDKLSEALEFEVVE